MELGFLDVVIATGRAVGLMAILVLAYSTIVLRLRHRSVLRQLTLGLLFGGIAVIAMVDPIELAPGLIADARTVPVVLAAPFGGPIALILAAAMTGAYRLWLGGVGALPSLASLAIVCTVAMVYCRFVAPDPARTRLRHIFILALASNLWLLSMFLLPYDAAVAFLSGAAIPVVLVTFLGVMLAGILLSRERRRIAAEDEVWRLARVDQLTGIGNRRAFDDELASAVAYANRLKAPLALILIDIDWFKAINDRYGHTIGDDVLASVGAMLKAAPREEDIVARVGGEEFAILLRGSTEEGAKLVAESLRLLFETTKVPTRDGLIPITISAGVAHSSGGRMETSEFMRLADEALYTAKRLGRNRVSVARANHPEASQPTFRPRLAAAQ